MAHDCDVLILGAGLAGLRAAWSALEEHPGGRVLVVAPSDSPSSSSFANLNTRLGMQAPRSDDERTRFVQRARDLAAPGVILPELAEVLAAESLARLGDLTDLGVTLQTTGDGAPQRHPGCFARDLDCTVLLTDLPQAYRLLRRKIAALGAEFLPGHLALSILTSGKLGACGALLAPLRGGPLVPVRSGTVVAALGGPAPLFTQHLAGQGMPGVSYGLLAGTGAELANEGFIQFLWSRLDSRQFVHIARLGEAGAAVIGPDGEPRPLPADLASLAVERATHCPISWGRTDKALDLFALDHAAPDGIVTLHLPGEPPFRAAPMAHCGNGGALIDRHGHTSVPGLFAAGECATGMHGANRIGGAMVAATQVFGARAGKQAMRLARDRGPVLGKLFSELTNPLIAAQCATLGTDPGQRSFLTPANVSTMLHLEAQNIDIIIENILEAAPGPTSSFAHLSALSALTVARSLHRIA